MEKISSQLLQVLGDSAAAHPALAAAAASGLVGGAMTAGTARRRGETSGQRLTRILRNSLLAAGAGGGAVALGQKALENFNTALPSGDLDPVERKFTSIKGRLATGALGTWAAHSWAGRKDQLDRARKELSTHAGIKGEDLPENARKLFKTHGLTKGLINSEHGSKIHAGIDDALLAAHGKRAPWLEDFLKKIYLGAADRELYAAGLPTVAHEGSASMRHAARLGVLKFFDAKSKPARTAARGVRDLLGLASGPARVAARGAYNVLGTRSRFTSTGSPLLRTTLGLGLGVLAPNLIGGAWNIGKDYAAQPQ